LARPTDTDEDGSGTAWFHREHGGPVPQAPSERRDTPAGSGIWTKCDGCGEYLRSEALDDSARVCPQCGHHHSIGGYERLAILVDEGSFEELDREVSSSDPLDFVDSKGYPARLAAAIQKTGSNSAFASGRARVCDHKVQIGTFLFDFLGGSMGSAVGEKVTRMFERGVLERTPVVCVSASGGARMQEGVLSLMQMARSTAAVSRLRDAGLPYISVLTHPTTGGVAASFAMLGDIIVAEPKALIGFAGPRVIEQTIRQVLPDGFQRSEFLLEHGMLDQIVDRRHLRERIGSILSLLLG
jgi:acetyl-CoA carboxylase carboxyl transferase subunit beta